MKKFLIVFLMLLIVMPTNTLANDLEGLHYSNGWFDNNPGKFQAPLEIVDNNIKTYKTRNFEIVFDDVVDAKFIAFYSACYVSSSSHKIIFYDENNNVVKSYDCKDNKTPIENNLNKESYVLLNLDKEIKKIEFKTSGSSAEVKEFEVFDQIAIESVKNLKAEEITFDSAIISYELPFRAIAAKVYLNNVFVGKVDKPFASYTLENLKSDTDYVVSVTAVYDKMESQFENLNIRTKSLPELKSSDVTISNITKTSATASIKLSDFTKVQTVYLYDGQKKMKTSAALPKATTVFQLNFLEPETEYTYFYSVTYKNGESSDYIAFNFKTDLADREIINLKATAKYDEVALEWTMPKHSVEKVVIYRKKSGELKSFMKSLFADASGFTSLFETNGTSFKDLSVSADTQYTYKLTTVENANETRGKEVTIKTPKIQAIGGGTNPDGNGNYTVSWEKPIVGQMQVWIGGKLYKTVPAADKKIVIPAKDMKFDVIGNLDVKLVPITPDGKEGVPTSPGAPGGSGGIGDINVRKLLEVAVALLTIVGGFVLLGLAFRVVPKLIHTIRAAYEAKRGAN